MSRAKNSILQIDVASEALARARRDLADVPGGVDKAFARAGNRAIAAGKTVAARLVTQDYAIKSGDVKKTMTVKKLSAKDPVGEVMSRGKRMPLVRFKHRPASATETTGKNRQRIRVEVRKGKPKAYPQSFKHKGQIFTRVGSRSYPLEFPIVISVPEMLNAGGRHEVVEKTMTETLAKRLDHETKRILDKVKNG